MRRITMGMGFHLGVMKIFQNSGRGDGCTTLQIYQKAL